MAEEFKLPNAINLDLNNLFYDQKDLLSGTNLFENGNGSAAILQTKWDTIGNIQFYELSQEKWFVGNPCGEGILGGLNNNIQKLFEILKTVQKFNDTYVQGSINKVKKLQGSIRSIISAMAGILKTLVQRVRNWILNKVKGLIENALEQALPPLLKTIKESLAEAIFDQIFCAFEKILKGLFDLVGDFIYSLIGQIINAPLCAIEQWTNALINNLVNKIDSVLNPIFNQINDILSGVAQISGSVSSAISTILGFQGFLCGQPDCPELQEFINDLNGSVSPSAVDKFNKFNFISDNFAGEITETANEWLDDFFGKDSNSSQSPGECYTGTFECGIPQIVIFGGGGSGAVAQAVVNKIGQVIGANLLSGGSGYKSPPFVSIVDPAGCGVNATGYAILGENVNNEDSVVEVVIDNPGNNYNQNYNGGAPVINIFRGSPNPIVVGSSLIIDWDVSNADTVSLNVPGYASLPLVGSISIPITIYDVLFEPNEDKTTKIFTLTATKNNLDSASQTISKNFILTVLKEGSPLSSEVNNLQPRILNFTASPNKVNPGEIVNLSWQTENSTSVSLNVEGLNSLPSNGNVSVVIPSKYSFPSDGSNGTETYTLVVKNSNAPSNRQTVTEKTNVTILRPSTDSESNVGSGSTVPISDDGIGDDGINNDASGTGNNNAISSIKEIDIINTGIGYTAGDTVIVDDGDNNGSEFELDVNQIGQIVGIRATSPGYGFTNIPTLSIQSSTGLGADFRVRLKFTPLNEFLNDMKLQTIDPNKLVQVVDCVGTSRATINNPLEG